MRTRLVSILALTAAVGLWACGDFATAPTTEGLEPESTQLRLVIAAPQETDVAGLRIWIERVPCGAEAIVPLSRSVDLPLEGPMAGDLVPGAIDAGLDAGDEYYFADSFHVVPAGCYDVGIVPLDAAGSPSADCEPATLEGVVVEDGETTEVVLVSECQGDNEPVGGLDVVGALDLNMPPQILIEGASYWPSKFDPGCHGVIVCVSASDPDGDELQWVWEQTGGDRLFDAPVVLGTALDGGVETQCVGIVPAEVGQFAFQVTVYDLHDGVIDPGSKDELAFPLYAIGDCM